MGPMVPSGAAAPQEPSSRPAHEGAHVRRSSALAGLAGLVIAAALVAWSLQRAGGARFLESLATVSPWILLPALLCEATVQAAKAARWTGLLAPIQRVSFASALRAVLVGGMATHVIPLRLDEVLRAKVLGDAEGIPPATVLGTVAVDRIIEILALGTLLGLVAATSTLPPPLEAGLLVAWVAFVVGAAGLLGFVLAEERLSALLLRIPMLRRLQPLAREMASGLRSLPRGRALARVLGGILAEWTATIALYGFVLLGFGLTPPTSVPLTLAVGGAAAYGVPNVPGAIGTFEAAQSTLLAATLHLPPAECLAIAVLAHAILTIPITVAGAAVALGIALRHKAQSPT